MEKRKSEINVKALSEFSSILESEVYSTPHFSTTG
ncbi:hypothetical protein IX306_000040 [Porphyromonas levii]|nr:hypothetical protein [Porphyromonas levii]MBR8807715.1 hypothetical protein [Porphyromonas levii]